VHFVKSLVIAGEGGLAAARGVLGCWWTVILGQVISIKQRWFIYYRFA
jgi:hypothetical protein